MFFFGSGKLVKNEDLFIINNLVRENRTESKWQSIGILLHMNDKTIVDKRGKVCL